MTTPQITSPARIRLSPTKAGKAVLNVLSTAVIALAVVLVLWVGTLWALNVPAFVGKGPLDVWNYLFVVPASEANRTLVLTVLGETLVDASIGFTAGLAAALILAAIFLLLRPVENALMPVALMLSSVPLIALAPIIILIFGRGTATVAVMGALVVVFPALVTIVFGLRSTSPFMTELVRVYGGGKMSVLTKVALPAAIPAFFAAVRIALPGSITGALLAEWLATGQGIGRAIIAAVAQAKMSEVWTLAAVATAASILLYVSVSIIESAVLSRIGMRRSDA